MTLDNLLSGLIGAIIGGLIVVAAEQWRWRRENKGAARMVFTELHVNMVYLTRLDDAVPEQRSITDINMVSTSVWEAERVRVAAALDIQGQMTLTTAYQGVAAILRLMRQLDSKAADNWLRSTAAGDSVHKTLVMLRLASGALEHIVPISSEAIDEWNREIDKVKKQQEAEAPQD